MKNLLKLFGLALGVAVAMSMAEPERVPDKATSAGKEPTVIEPLVADTQIIPNKNGKVQLRITNANEADTIVTVVTPNEAGGNPIEDKKVEVKKTKTKIIGPFDPAVYNNAKGNLEVKFSSVLGVKLEINETDF